MSNKWQYEYTIKNFQILLFIFSSFTFIHFGSLNFYIFIIYKTEKNKQFKQRILCPWRASI